MINSNLSLISHRLATIHSLQMTNGQTDRETTTHAIDAYSIARQKVYHV